MITIEKSPILQAVILASEESYNEEDNCSGTLYAVPEHLTSLGQPCSASNRVFRENETEADSHDSYFRIFKCPGNSCGGVVRLIPKDAFGE